MRVAAIADDPSLSATAVTTVTTVADPTPGPGDLVLAVTGCGVCGSDVKSHAVMPAGTVMGHEFSGQVVAAGAEVASRWKVGSHATALPVFSCGVCDLCRRGDVAHCTEAVHVGLGGAPGGFAELVRVSADLAVPLPEGLDPTLGPLVEPFAVGLHVARAAQITTGDRVLVLGGGAVGLTSAAWARLLGAAEVTVSDPLASRRDRADAFGATAVVDPTVEDLGGPYDVVIEGAGAPGLLDAAVSATGVRGRIVMAGFCMTPEPFTSVSALLKEVTVRFAVYYHPAEFVAVVDAFAAGRLDPTALLTRTAPLSEVGDLLSHPSPDDLKVVVDPTLP